MISLTLRFPEDSLPRITGAEAAKFMLDILKENPGFALKAAVEIEVRGPTIGRMVEQR